MAAREREAHDSVCGGRCTLRTLRRWAAIACARQPYECNATACDRPRALHQAAGNHTRGWEQRSAGARRMSVRPRLLRRRSSMAAAHLQRRSARRPSTAAQQPSAIQRRGTATGLRGDCKWDSPVACGAQRARGRRSETPRPPRAAKAGQRHMAYSGYSHRTLWVLTSHTLGTLGTPTARGLLRTCAVSPSHRDKR